MTDWYISIKFKTPDSALALGVNGNLARSTDGGATWREVLPRPIPGGYYTGMSLSVSQPGLIVATGGLILRSGDGGSSWETIPSGTTHDLRSVSMTDPLHGYITGNQGIILKTADGGLSWERVPTVTTTAFVDGCFTDSLMGYIAAGKDLIKSTDGFSTWDTVLHSDSAWGFSKLYRLNDSTIFAAGSKGVLFRSTDRGNKWKRLPIGTVAGLNAVCFSTPLKGFAAGTGGTLLMTTDGGDSWSHVNTGFPHSLLGLTCRDEWVAFAYGAAGAIFTTTDGGATWEPISFVTIEDLASVDFPSADIGLACGSGGTVIRSADGGKSWEPIKTGISDRLLTIHMADVATGFAAGENGIIIGTTDGGTTWTRITSPAAATWYSIFFGDGTKGFLAGSVGVLYRTTDGGLSWTGFPTGQNTGFRSVRFSGSTGFAGGYEGVLMRSTDDGVTWSRIEVPELAGVTIEGLFSVDDDHWFLIGNRVIENTNIMYFAATADKGLNWEVRTRDLFSYDRFNSLFFTDNLTGYIGGSGFIIKTTDGGKSWIDQTPANVPAGPAGICFSTGQNGVAVGGLGQILLTTNGGGVGFAEKHVASEGLLKQNYPNPFRGSTTIRWHLSEPSHVRLCLFDGTGRLEATLADGEFPQGEHVVVFRPERPVPGVYYYQIITRSGSEIRKLIITGE